MIGKFKKFIVIIIMIIITNENLVFADGNISNNGGINFKRITIEDGLSQTTVEYIYQDSDGYMWFGTDNGLNKYDGTNFEVYKYKGEDENSISGDIIVSIIEDSNGYLWIGTTTGLNKLNRKTGKIKRYLADGSNGSISDGNICEMFVDSKDRMWVATNQGLNLYDNSSDSFTRVLYSDEYDVLTSQSIYSIVEDEDNVYWIATDKGLNKYYENTGQVVKYTSNDEKKLISNNSIFDLYMDKNNILWVSTSGGGLNRINTKTEESIVFRNDENDKNSIPSNYVRSVLRDSNDDLWICTDNGLGKLNEKTNEFTVYNSKIYDTNTLVNDRVISIYESKLGTIWIGTYDGLCLFNLNNIFTTYKNDPFNNNTLKSSMIMGVYKDNDGYIWVGSNDEGVNIIDRSKDKVYRLDKEGELNSLLTSTDITVINGYDNKIFIGTNNGINIIDKDKNEVIKYLESDNHFDSNKSKIREIYIDNDKLVWIGTRDGLYTIDENYKLSNLNDLLEDNNINDRLISSVYEDNEGEIWIGLSIDGGVVRYNKETGKVINYTSDDKNRLSYNSVKDINGDSLGNIWIATNYGLNKFNKSENKFTQYTEDAGLANNFIYGILFDEEDNPWVSTNNGLSKYDINKDKFINFSVNDGLQGNEFNGYSYFKASDGEMFFGGIDGLNSFYPNDYKEREVREKVNISKVQINGESINFDNVIELGRGNNSIQIQYFLADYRNISKIKYYYKMEGIDEEWISAENRNYVSYNNLFAGEYEFLVVARNSYGDICEEVQSIKIIKDPPIFMSKIAFIIYSVAISFILYRRWNRVKILNKLVEQRTKQLNNKLIENKILYEKLINQEKRKNNYFINLSHELRTPLNVILSIEQLITELNKKDNYIDKKKLNHYMDVLRGNSKRLLKLINDIIDTSKIEAGMYKLDIRDNDIVYLVEELALSMKDFIESKGIELIIDPEIEEKIIECDSGEIEKCIVNILGNAAKFTKAGGKIKVIINEENKFVNIKIKDNGIGIDKKDMKSIFDRFGQVYNKKTEEFGGSGIGLTLTKQIIELHNGELLVNSELGKGSEFTIKLPEKQP